MLNVVRPCGGVRSRSPDRARRLADRQLTELASRGCQRHRSAVRTPASREALRRGLAVGLAEAETDDQSVQVASRMAALLGQKFKVAFTRTNRGGTIAVGRSQLAPCVA